MQKMGRTRGGAQRAISQSETVKEGRSEVREVGENVLDS